MVVLDLPPPPVPLLERRHLQELVRALPLPYLKPVLLLPVAVLEWFQAAAHQL